MSQTESKSGFLRDFAKDAAKDALKLIVFALGGWLLAKIKPIGDVLTTLVPVPLWVLLALAIVVVIAGVLRFRQYRRKATKAAASVKIPPIELSEFEVLVVGVLADADGTALLSREIARRVGGGSRMLVQQALGSLRKRKFVLSQNTRRGLMYAFSSAGRDYAIAKGYGKRALSPPSVTPRSA